MEYWTRFRAWLSLLSDFLGAATLLYATVAWLGSLVASVINPLPFVAKGALGVGVTATLALFLSLVTHLAYRRKGEKHNPYLAIEDTEALYNIAPNKIERHLTRTVKALKGNVERLTFFYGPIPKEVDAEVDLLSPGDLEGPIRAGGNDLYQVRFPNALSRGQTYELEARYRLEAESGVDTWLAEEFTNYGDYNECKIELNFEERPASCRKAPHPKKIGVPSEDAIRRVMLDGNDRHIWRFDIQDGYRYTVDWDWP